MDNKDCPIHQTETRLRPSGIFGRYLKLMFIELEILYLSANRLANFYIDVSNNSDGSSAEQCAYDSVPYGGSETRVYTCPDGIYGRYVRVHYASDKQEHLQLCEVQVQGTSE